MRYRALGGTGIEVSVHCLGTMMFGAIGNPDHDDCVRITHAALDAGINFVDTADMYGAGESEEIVPPGTDTYRADGAWQPPTIADPAQRRRPVAERAAG